MSELPGLLELLGNDDTLRLVEAFGGTRIFVPIEVKEKHPLREALGLNLYKKLIRYYRGSHLLVPLAKPWRIGVYRQQKMTHREIARRVGCGEGAVYRALKKQEIEQQQMSLEV